MGRMRFHAPQLVPLSEDAVNRAYLAGIEGIPWRCRNRQVDGQLIIQRDVSESGNLFIPWQVPGRGTTTLSTASLMERDAPYRLLLELARGTLNRARNLSAELSQAGCEASDAVQDLLSRAHHSFAAVATARQGDDGADEVVRLSLEAIDMLVDQQAEFLLGLRHRQEPRLPTLFGCRLDTALPVEAAKEYNRAFTAVAVSVPWSEIQPTDTTFHWEALEEQFDWCQQNQMRVCAGPLFCLDREALPDWIYLWEDDYSSLESLTVQFVDAVVRRFRHQVHLWHCASRLNATGAMALTEEHKLRLAVATIEAVRRADPKTPVVISLDQPWGEYLATEDQELSPLHFADALTRADLGIAGVGMEMNLGFWPRGTLTRDALEISKQVDRWSYLGLPLLLMISSPSTADPDPASRSAAEVVDPQGRTPLTQRREMERLLPLLLAKPSVQGILWNQISDAVPHDFPNAGLFDTQWNGKPVLEECQVFRSRHLI